MQKISWVGRVSNDEVSQREKHLGHETAERTQTDRTHLEA